MEGGDNENKFAPGGGGFASVRGREFVMLPGAAICAPPASMFIKFPPAAIPCIFTCVGKGRGGFAAVEENPSLALALEAAAAASNKSRPSFQLN